MKEEQITEVLVSIAQQAFGVEVTEGQHFTSVAGSSLHIIRFKSLIEKELNVTLPLSSLLSCNDLQSVAELISSTESTVIENLI